MDHGKQNRLLEAMLAELGERGYENTTVENVIARAEVSRAAFDAEFPDRDACLFAAYDALTERLLGTATASCAGGHGEAWARRVRAGLEALLDELAAEPAIARALTRAFPAIRPAAHQRYMEFLEAFTPSLREGRKLSGRGDDLPGEIEMLAVGSAESVIVAEIEADRTSHLPVMAPAILFSLLVPFLGPEAASAAMQEAAGQT
jgi:AcrR family transcriptional regulator